MIGAHRTALEPAFVLHSRPYRDSSLLLEVFSREHGRLGLVARGARSSRSRWRAQLQGFTPLLLSWNMRGELGTLTGVDYRDGGGLLTGRRLLSGYYVNELVMRLLTRHDPHPALFDHYEQAITGLEASEEPTLRIFEKRLLEALGYGLLLDQEAETGVPVDIDGMYEYHLERGPVRCENTRRDGLYLHGSSLLALHDEVLVDPVGCREAKRLMRAALSLYLGAQPLKSREVLRQFATFRRPGQETRSRRDTNG